jgi:hypothetical protein
LRNSVSRPHRVGDRNGVSETGVPKQEFGNEGTKQGLLIGALMWACPICGREHAKLYDARWNCVCRTDPYAVRAARARLTARLIRAYLSLALRILLGLVIGAALGTIMFSITGVPPWEGMGLGAAIGALFGIVWGLLAAFFLLAPFGDTVPAEPRPKNGLGAMPQLSERGPSSEQVQKR